MSDMVYVICEHGVYGPHPYGIREDGETTNGCPGRPLGTVDEIEAALLLRECVEFDDAQGRKGRWWKSDGESIVKKATFANTSKSGRTVSFGALRLPKDVWREMGSPRAVYLAVRPEAQRAKAAAYDAAKRMWSCGYDADFIGRCECHRPVDEFTDSKVVLVVREVEGE